MCGAMQNLGKLFRALKETQDGIAQTQQAKVKSSVPQKVFEYNSK